MKLHSALALSMLFAASLAGESYEYHYFKESKSLSLRRGSLAILEGNGNEGQRNASLQGAGIEPSQLRSFPITGWSIAELSSIQTANVQTEQLVQSLASRDGIGFISPVFNDDAGLPMFVTPAIHIGFKEDISESRVRAIITQFNAGEILEKDWGGMKGVYRVRTSSRNGFEVLNITNQMTALEEVLFAEPDWMITGKGEEMPNDPNFPIQWALHNTGQNGGTPDMDMDAPEVFDVTHGDTNIIVVVIDVGVDLGHPDLNLAPGADFTGNGSQGGPINDCDNHGTAVAGCISARMNNNLGVAGIAPNCRVASAKIGVSTMDCSGSWNGSTSFSVNAINWAHQIGARVTNNSNSYGTPTAAITTAYNNSRANGVVHFVSAGNDSRGSLSFPASVGSVNAVAALDRRGNLATFSNWGEGLDFSAPGVQIFTTDRQGAAGYNSGGDYATVQGTSFASPYTAGIAALVLSVNPALTPDEVEWAIALTCVDRGAAGYDTTFGWGFVNANAAVRYVMPCPPPPADRSLVLVNQTNNTGCENGTAANPYNTVVEGVQGVSTGGVVQIQAATYREFLNLNRAMRLQSTGGVTTIRP